MGLADFLVSRGTIATKLPAADWRDAVRRGVDLLVHAGAAESAYFDAIVDATREHGPYYVIAPGIAMPHARGTPGLVHDAGFSLVTLESPVAFGNRCNDPVDIVLCVCAADGTRLTSELIVQVMELFDDDTNVAAIRAALTPADLAAALGWEARA